LPFEIKFTLDALKDVQRLDGSVKRKLKNTLYKKLSVDPLSYGTPLRAPLVNYYKHEFATHRIIYRVYSDRNLVVACAVGPRKSGDVQDVYRQLTKLVQSGRLAAQVQAVLENVLKGGL
jgi:mRNA-degrading endonuclease RelE of RelBE toxin-antitoxin system